MAEHRNYIIGERQFIAILHKTGVSLYNTIPKEIVKDLGLRPGSKVRIYIKEVLSPEELSSKRPEEKAD